MATSSVRNSYAAGRVPASFPVRPLRPGQKARDKVTCGVCGRSWDDAKSTEYTPAPAGRCPFEYFHARKSSKRAGHAAGYKGHDFKVGDIVKHKAKFLQSVGWYTNVPKDGKVTAVRGDIVTVMWNNYFDEPTGIHAANIMHAKKPDYSGLARGSKKLAKKPAKKAAKKPVKKAAKKPAKKAKVCQTVCRTGTGRFKACR